MSARPATHPALVIVLHGSMGSGEQAREAYGYDFDLLADRNGSIAVYPQGYEGHWNDCKVKGPYAAKRENIDDVGFLHALVDRFVKDHAVDRTRVYVTGVSNGGSMTLCLAFQTPDFARAYAAVVASVPTPENMAVTPTNQPVSVLLMDGTDDPINPWQGGDVVLWPVLANRGPVLSVPASIDYFRGLDGLDGAPRVTRFPDRDPDDGSTVERELWSAPGKRSVALYTIQGGGHDVWPTPARQHQPRHPRRGRDLGLLPVGAITGDDMNTSTIDESQRQAAVIAGSAFLFAMAVVVYANFGIYDQLVVSGNAAETARNIVAHELQFRFAAVCFLTYSVAVVVLTAALYVILAPVDRTLALVAAFCRLAFALMWGGTALNMLGALRLLGDAAYLPVFEATQLQALARLHLAANFDAYYVGLPFFALASTICSYLWFRSGYLPRALAAFGLISSAWCVFCGFRLPRRSRLQPDRQRLGIRYAHGDLRAGAGPLALVQRVGSGAAALHRSRRMTVLSRNARVAGFFYLLLTLAAPLRLAYIPSTLFVHGDAAATAANIAAHETLFRLGIASDLASGVILIFLTLALFRLFKEVDRDLAVLMVVVGGVLPAAIDFFNVLNDAAALILVHGADFLNVFDRPQLNALAMLFLRIHGQVIVGAEILWGLWLFPLALLTIRSRFLPRFLGYWLIVNGFAYLVLSFTGVFLPQYEDAVSTYALPAQLGEVAFMLWILIMGAKERPAAAAAS